MLDRFGQDIRVGWQDYELLWLEAALLLDRAERNAAFWDIASMSGRTVECVRSRAARLWAQQQRDRAATSRQIIVPERYVPNPKLVGPTQLKAISMAQRMSGRASVSRRRPALEAAE